MSLGLLRYCYFNRGLTFSYFANMEVTAGILGELIYARLCSNNFHITLFNFILKTTHEVAGNVPF